MSRAEQQVAGQDPLAEAAVAPITSGMTVGLGTGRAAARGILALARRARLESLDLRCVATSSESEELARSHGLKVVDLAAVDHIDFLFDGADEVDSELRMLKGGHGAVVGERLAAFLAEQRVYMVQRDKIVQQLGRRPLPVIVLPHAGSAVKAGLLELRLQGTFRRTPDGGDLFRADNGHLVLDVPMNHRDPDEIAEELDHLPGVVDHGLFLDECDELLIESPDAPLRRKTRAD